MAEDYGGLLGGLVFAFRRSDSYLLRLYELVCVLVGGFVSLLLILGMVTWLATPAPIGQRALLGVLAIVLLGPLFAPVLLVARRHRWGVGRRRSDALLGLAGLGFVLGVYLALFISDPNAHTVTGPLAPAIDAIDGLPRSYWVLPPVLAILGIVAAAWLTRADGDAA